MHKIIKVMLPRPKLFPLDYLARADVPLEVGSLVVVPFRNKELVGIVCDGADKTDVKKIKEVNSNLPFDSKISPAFLQFIQKASEYYGADLGAFTKLVLPVDIAQKPIKIKTQELPLDFNLPQLSAAQEECLNSIKVTDRPIAIKGVTGSGKTEVYFHLAAEYLQQGRQVLILLPEISLSAQTLKRFTARFGFEPVVWNSTVTPAQKRMILRGILTGQVKAVVGARSALFLPYKDLGLIVVDEEHDSSYKQEDGVLYHARDMAVLRGNMTSAKVVLCSATPSIETLHNAQQDKYHLVELQSRYNAASLPEVKVVDMRAQDMVKNTWISPLLKLYMKEALSAGQQVLLFLNRRGYSPLMLCKSCGYRFTCPSCSAWLVMHKARKRLECHHCGYCSKIYSSCPQCHLDDSLYPCGPGIERIAEEATMLFPDYRIEVISKDYTSSVKELEGLIGRMEKHEIDILIGTQMITKGHHFPNLTLVGVIDADLGLSSGDLRATEKTYQLLHQVAGRAGREGKKGMVLLQTYLPESPLLTALTDYQEEEFLKYEMENRKSSDMPPFTKMASIILTGKNEAKTLEFAKYLASIAPSSEARILGPAQALMSKLSGKYRYRILIIAERKFHLQKYLKFWLEQVKIPSFCHIKIDIDPQNFF